MVVAALWTWVALLACDPSPVEATEDRDPRAPCADDPCRAEQVAALFQIDYAAGLEMLRAIEDPVYLSLAVNRVVDTRGSTLTPEQGREICEVAAAVMVQSHCERRFKTPHLRSELDRRQPPGGAGDPSEPATGAPPLGHQDPALSP